MPDRWDAAARRVLCCCSVPEPHAIYCPASNEGIWYGVAEALRCVYRETLERAAALHENVSPRCDHEPTTGAGAARAVIEYRDAIRREIEGS